MVGPKMQAFCHDHAMLKGNRCILRIQGAPVCQKVPKLYFKSQFSMSKIKQKRDLQLKIIVLSFRDHLRKLEL